MAETPVKLKILYVDDSPIMLQYVAGLLAKTGVAVVTAETLETAVATAHYQRPAAILADFVLEGGRTGLSVLSAIFALSPAKESRPLVAILTLGSLSRADERQAGEMGARIIQKPSHGKEADFLTEINDWLRPIRGGMDQAP